MRGATVNNEKSKGPEKSLIGKIFPYAAREKSNAAPRNSRNKHTLMSRAEDCEAGPGTAIDGEDTVSAFWSVRARTNRISFVRGEPAAKSEPGYGAYDRDEREHPILRSYVYAAASQELKNRRANTKKTNKRWI